MNFIYKEIGSSLLFDPVNLSWSIVYIEVSYVIISKKLHFFL